MFIDHIVRESLKKQFSQIEDELQSDVLAYYGHMYYSSDFSRIIEEIGTDRKKSKTLNVILSTLGGDITAVERYVDIIRHHYDTVHFFVPDYAYSAGTVFCMSGDKIFMDYFSILGPIDPQVENKDGKWVAALGYLDKFNEMVEKSSANNLTAIEFTMIKYLDLAELRSYEQAKELTVELLQKWLVKFKFKNWTKHKDGKNVLKEEKVKRAKEIADKLGDSNMWKSHNRPINSIALAGLKLKIDRLEGSPAYRNIRSYNTTVRDYMNKNQKDFFIQTKNSYE